MPGGKPTRAGAWVQVLPTMGLVSSGSKTKGLACQADKAGKRLRAVGDNGIAEDGDVAKPLNWI